MLQKLASAASWIVALMVLLAACAEDPVQETLCDPGSNVFCRCRGTLEPGTKLCNDQGDAFGQCEGPFGECDEAPLGGGGAGASSSAGGSGGRPMAEPGEIYSHCDEENDLLCNDGLVCAHGYCTKSCMDYTECQPLGDCVVATAGMALCAPYCKTQDDCAPFGTAAGCGFTNETLPPFDVVVCAQWGDEHYLPPDGYGCDDDEKCHLGFAGTERVCDAMSCVDGCHADADCSDDGATCSGSAGVLGDCGGGTGEDVDVCPGISVALSAGVSQTQVSGNTSLAAPPSEADGEGNCAPLSPTEEDIYHLTVEDAGEVIILLETSDVMHDPVLYVRSGSCEAGAQVVCADDEAAGGGEITSFMATAGQEFWIFVDGFFGSTGAYTMDLDLTVQ